MASSTNVKVLPPLNLLVKWGPCGYNVDIDPSAGHTDPSIELVFQSN